MALLDQQQPVVCRDPVALNPRPDGCNRRASQLGDYSGSGGSYDVGMGSHSFAMHYASQECKRLLHNELRYSQRMSDPAERLRIARVRAGFATAKEAAEAMNFPVSTYLAHENGSRGYPAKKAFTYARKFRVREQWLLYGVGPAPGETDAPEAEVVGIFSNLPPLRRAEALGYLRALANDKST